ncbi:general secretion pathway protein GspK [bacterium]|nr:general secretion pathway protein GspK [bacterium]
MLAITSLMFMVYIASELTQDSAVEYIVNSQEMNRLKAYYAARNSMQIALLRIKMFQQANKFPLPESFKSQLDLIWKFPFAWPLPIPADLNAVDTDTIKQVTSESLMDATYTHTIDDEGSKIDINDLASPSKTLREITRKQVLTIFEQQLASNDEFRNEYQNYRFDELVNKMTDWMSDTNTSASGSGDKRSEFSQLGFSYPPNRGFRTLEELRLIPGMTDAFFDLLASRVTIYGMKAINPNIATKEVLLSLDAGLTEESINEAIARRDNPDQGGPFKDKSPDDPSKNGCLEDFKSFVESRGARLTADFDKIPMSCDKVFNFKIKATGLYGAGKFALQKNITAVVVDLDKSATQIKTYVDKDKQAQNPQGQNPQNPANPQNPSGQQGAGSTSGTSDPLPKGPPRVVYWTEN